MKRCLILPVLLMMFGAVVPVASTARAADKPEQDLGALIQALNERLETQEKKSLKRKKPKKKISQTH